MIKHRVVSVSFIMLVLVGLIVTACGTPQPTPLPPPPTAEPTQPQTETPVPTVEPTATPTLPPTAAPTVAPTATPTAVATQTIYAALKAAPQFSTLVAALEQAGLTKTLELPGPFTLFAPNDNAFKALPQDQIEALLKNDTLLSEVLLYHVVPGRYAAANLSTVQTLTTALTSTVLTVAGSGTGITINAAAIVSPDLAASNGLVHEIANVLLPTQVSAAAPSPTGTALITGTISYLPRIALDPKAVIDVQLQDVSLADAPARTIASQSIDAQGRQVPITFTLPYDPAVINAKNRYALAVRISVNGQLRFVNTTAIPVLTNGARSTNLEVLVDPVTSVAGAEGVTPTLAVLTGTVTYPASARLPAAAVLDVQLHDVTTSPALVIAAQSAAVTGRSAPLSYTLKYDPTLIDPKHTYAINARLLVDGRPLYINPISATVQTQGKPATGLALPVEAVSGAPLADDLVTITGTLDIDAATLNPAAVIEVQLQDVSRTDAPAQVVSVQVITAARQSTAIPFTLYYNPYAIDPAHHYQLTARVTISAEVQYESTDQYPVLTAGQLSGVAMKAEALAIAALPPATIATPTAPTPTPTPAPVAGSGVLTGTINGAQPITLTANAEIVVKLLDVSRLDAPSQVVAEQTISVSGQQLPIPFTLNYDAAQIDSTHYYMLLATISVNGELGWLNPQAVWALTYGNAPGNITVMVQPVP